MPISFTTYRTLPTHFATQSIFKSVFVTQTKRGTVPRPIDHNEHTRHDLSLRAAYHAPAPQRAPVTITRRTPCGRAPRAPSPHAPVTITRVTPCDPAHHARRYRTPRRLPRAQQHPPAHHAPHHRTPRRLPPQAPLPRVAALRVTTRPVTTLMSAYTVRVHVL